MKVPFSRTVGGDTDQVLALGFTDEGFTPFRPISRQRDLVQCIWVDNIKFTLKIGKPAPEVPLPTQYRLCRIIKCFKSLQRVVR